MLDILREKLKTYPTDQAKYHYLREYLQLLVLKLIDEYGYFRNLAFVGGTALRILYDIRRFSEDLDFSLVSAKNYDFATMLQQIERQLQNSNLKVAMSYKDQKTVASAFIKFEELLPKLIPSFQASQKLSIKIEVDQNPPAGAKTEFTMVNKEYLTGIQHYDLPSLFAGKLHAILYRTYTKGRDYYDWLWFSGKKIEPNLVFLSNAISQTEKKEMMLDKSQLAKLLSEKIQSVDFKKIKQDIVPFLMDNSELRFFERDIFLGLINITK